MSSSRKRLPPARIEPLAIRQIGDERWRVIASAYFDHDLRRVASRGEADNWLAVALLYLPGDVPRWFCEIVTRFLVMAAGRDRPRCLRMIGLIAREQERWRRLFGVEFAEYGAKLSQVSGPEVPRVLPTFVGASLDGVQHKLLLEVVRRQVLLDERLVMLPDLDRATGVRVAVALVHPPELDVHSHCAIRTLFGFRTTGRGVERALQVCRAIAHVQQQRHQSDGASFFVPGRVKPYLVPVRRGGSPPPVRDFGRRSHANRQVEVRETYEALEVLATAWDAYVLDPYGARALAFGFSNLCAAAHDAAKALEALRPMIGGGMLSPNTFTPGERERIAGALADGSLSRLDSYLRNRVERLALRAISTPVRRTPTAADTVLELVCVLPAGPQARFAPAGRTRCLGGRPVLTGELVRRVGRSIYPDGLRTRARPGTLEEPLMRLTAAILARRYRERPGVLLRDLVNPALQERLAGYVVFADEAARETPGARRRRPHQAG
jgi:hypothetical protein